MTHPLHILADRVEGLTSACRETDALIAASLRLGAEEWAWAQGYPAWEGRSDGRVYLESGGPSFAAPAYTASMDAATALMPEGWVLTLSIYGEGAGASMLDDRVCPVRLPGVSADGATPALALTAACLRAIAANQEPKP